MKINYKQENQNLHLPEETESEVLFCTIQKDNLDIMDDPILFREKSYLFVNFINTKLGKQEVFSEDEMYITHSDFWCVDFTNRSKIDYSLFGGVWKYYTAHSYEHVFLFCPDIDRDIIGCDFYFDCNQETDENLKNKN